jgi:hypothetical protein
MRRTLCRESRSSDGVLVAKVAARRRALRAIKGSGLQVACASVYPPCGGGEAARHEDMRPTRSSSSVARGPTAPGGASRR